MRLVAVCDEQKDAGNFLETAQKHGIPLTSLPSYLGGSHPGRPMNSTFRPSMSDTPLPVAVATTAVEHVPMAEAAASEALTTEEQPVPAFPIGAEETPAS